jgi:TolB-like protein
VLPFVNMSDDKSNDYFSDGLTEELLNVLAKVQGLRVIARTSSFAFKDKHPTIAEVSQTLGVDHVLEGSVRKSGDRVRITAQLIRAQDSSHLWSETTTGRFRTSSPSRTRSRAGRRCSQVRLLARTPQAVEATNARA